MSLDEKFAAFRKSEGDGMYRAQLKGSSHSSEAHCENLSPGKENAQQNVENGANGNTAPALKAAHAPFQMVDKQRSSLLHWFLSSPYVRCAA
jgi:hypothetical protein